MEIREKLRLSRSLEHWEKSWSPEETYYHSDFNENQLYKIVVKSERIKVKNIKYVLKKVVKYKGDDHTSCSWNPLNDF